MAISYHTGLFTKVRRLSKALRVFTPAAVAPHSITWHGSGTNPWIVAIRCSRCDRHSPSGSASAGRIPAIPATAARGSARGTALSRPVNRCFHCRSPWFMAVGPGSAGSSGGLHDRVRRGRVEVTAGHPERQALSAFV